jgi:hypothetical protein
MVCRVRLFVDSAYGMEGDWDVFAPKVLMSRGWNWESKVRPWHYYVSSPRLPRTNTDSV